MIKRSVDVREGNFLMSTVRNAKLVGILCSVAVLIAMYSGALAVAVMLFATLPAAIICRKKMNKEEKGQEKKI